MKSIKEWNHKEIKEFLYQNNDIPAGFCWELISHIEKFMKEKNIKMLATVASFKTDEQYDGASRDLHLSRKN